MSAIHTWACFLLWISSATQDKTPDAHVTCVFSEECVLPCSFQPGGEEEVQWFRQDVMVYSFQRDDDGSEEQSEHEHYSGRASLLPHLVSHGNATLVLRGCGPKDRGRYRCHVRNSAGVHEAHVVVKVEAPVRALTLELSRLSGYEEMKCTTRDVYPPPHVAWATEPPTFEVLRPITRKLADKHGLYTVESRLRRLKGHPELIYICKVSSSYGAQAWTASLREREIRGIEGRDLTVPCHTPPYLQDPSLSWTFTKGKDPAHILTYDSQSGQSEASESWEGHVELDTFRVAFGDGSLRLVDPEEDEHTGIYTCVFSSPYKTHTEHSAVIISAAGERVHSPEPSYWWIIALVIAVLVVALVGMLAYLYLKVKGSHLKPRKVSEEATELQLVKDATADSNLSDSSPLTVEDNNGQTSRQPGSPLT
ncbi:HERV-H LTR-associating protein 2 [Centroberyx affinis]|uniref:HERV-H LTR-associating protein 2 n=1 Tax=Centroberyx affinis TaxID=166261 RepID=UPI003A5BF874